MLSKRSTERLAGTLLLLGFFLFLVHIVVDGSLGSGRASVVLFLAYGFPASLAGLALYMTFRHHDPTLAVFGGFGFVTHVCSSSCLLVLRILTGSHQRVWLALGAVIGGRPPDRVGIFASSCHQAAAMNHWGRVLGMPQGISTHKSYR